MTSAIQKGVTPRKIVPRETSGNTLRKTKTFNPTGGVIKLISVTTTTITANQINTASGSNKASAPKFNSNISG